MSFLQLFWYVLIGVLFSFFLMFDGFDFGVGMATKFLAYSDKEKEFLLSTIGPHWDGNEVWLIAAAGSMFASMPLWYASLFSGFYLLVFLILIALIIRGVSFEFRDASESHLGKNFWLEMSFWSSLLAPFLIGMWFGAMIQKLPMDAKGNIFATFGNVVNPLSILGGIILVMFCLYQGLHYISLTTLGESRYHAAILATDLYFLAYPVEFLLVIALYFETNFYQTHPVATIIILMVVVLTTIWGQIASAKAWFIQAFVASSISIAALVSLVFVGLFPYVLISIEPKHSLLIKAASSSPYTLVAMTIALFIILPLLLGYYIWSYVFNKKPVSFKEFLETSSQGGY